MTFFVSSLTILHRNLSCYIEKCNLKWFLAVFARPFNSTKLALSINIIEFKHITTNHINQVPGFQRNLKQKLSGAE
jgi:hypothetical protein